MLAVYCISLLVCTLVYLGVLDMTNTVEYENRYNEDKKRSWKVTKWYVIAIAVITIYFFCIA